MIDLMRNLRIFAQMEIEKFNPEFSPSLVLLVIASVSFLVSLATLQIAPYSNDLYNLVYVEADRARAEGTYTFLFVFPMMQICAVPMYFFVKHFRIMTARKAAMLILGSVAFLLFNIWRCANTWSTFA